MELTISKKAMERIAVVRTKKTDPALMLRIVVEGGGCSGFQYNLEWDNTPKKDDDHHFANCVTIDDMSLSILNGATVDFVSNMMGEDFKIINPNAVSSCGCGTSFAI